MSMWSSLVDPARLAVAPTLTEETLARRAASMLRRFEAKRSAPPKPRQPGGARHAFKFKPKPEPPPKVRKPPSPALLPHLKCLNAARANGALLLTEYSSTE
jgi:hypothetical protein